MMFKNLTQQRAHRVFDIFTALLGIFCCGALLMVGLLTIGYWMLLVVAVGVISLFVSGRAGGIW